MFSPKKCAQKPQILVPGIKQISHGKKAIFFFHEKTSKKFKNWKKTRNVGSKLFSVQKANDSARTRTWNLWFRRPTRYPLRHRTSCCVFFLTLIRGQQETAGFGYINLLKRLMLQLISVQSASCALNQCMGLPCRRAVCHDTSQSRPASAFIRSGPPHPRPCKCSLYTSTMVLSAAV